MSVFHKLQAFIQAHQPCGILRSHAETPTKTGYLLLRAALLDLKDLASR